MTKQRQRSEAEGAGHAAGFFALRSPLLPFDTLVALADGLSAARAPASSLREALEADREGLRAKLRELVARPEVREAIFLASPVLDESIDVWRRDPTGERGQKIERSLYRYVCRMCARATPFGTFAGCSVGTVTADAPTELSLGPLAGDARHTRLDMDYVAALVDTLVRDPSIRRELAFRPNSSLYRIAGQLRYAEAGLEGGARTYKLTVVEPTAYLDATLARASGGATLGALAEALVADDAEIGRDEALGYLDQLVDGQILVAELAPPVTGPEPLPVLLAALRRLPSASALIAPLEAVERELEALDAAGLGADPARYRAVATTLGALPLPVELPRLFQVDMVKPAPSARLGPSVIAELTAAVGALHRLGISPADDPLVGFRAAFAERYGEREVPLCEVLDAEDGLGFETMSGPSSEVSPLLAAFAFPAGADGPGSFGARDRHLLRRLEETWRSGADELVLDERDLAALATPAPMPLPDAFCVLGSVLADSDEAIARGDFRVRVEGCAGPSGATLLGRFCHADPALAERVRGALRDEEAARPDTVFAEIVHLPEGRIGNILSRPLLRGHEIVFLGASGAPAAKQLSVDDLTVSVIGDRAVLRSRSLDREVQPRLTNAHNYARQSLGVYRFLCALQRQGVSASLGWEWGALVGAAFLPRVRLGKAILAPARWNFSADTLRKLGEGDLARQFEAVQRLRASAKLPRWVAVGDDDNLLPIDLDNVFSVDAFVQSVRQRDSIDIVELFVEGALCAHAPEGRFVHELVVPFHHAPAEIARAPRLPSAESVAPPGSEWLYLRLFTGASTADRVLLALGDTIDALTAEGAIDRWFFIRYADPEWHLRVRVHGDRQRLHAEVWPRLEAAARAVLDDGRARKLQLDTYEREVARYGGAEGMAISEQLFWVDSMATLEVLRSGRPHDERWRLTLAGMDALLDDLGLDAARKLALAEKLRDDFGREFSVDASFERQLGEKFRIERSGLDPLFAIGAPRDALWTTRSTRLRPVAEALREAEARGVLTSTRDELAASYLHMHANRMLRSSARAHELVFYDFLARLYRTQVVRARATRTTP